MNGIKAAFFDVGGVLLESAYWRKADRQLDLALKESFPNLDFRKLHETWAEKWSRRNRAASVEGFETMRNMAEKSLYESLVSLGCIPTKARVRRALDAWYAAAERNAKAMPGAKRALKRLKSLGYRTGIITNADWNVVIPHLRRAGLLGLIDYKIVSSRLRSYKPDQRLFKEALRVSKLRPEEVVFVGDSVEFDFEPAREVGMAPLLFK
ncbi:MAG: HAD family hydrolase, partial [Thermoproteota archaeon]